MLVSEAASDSVEAVEVVKPGEGSDSRSEELEGEDAEGDDDNDEARMVSRRDGRLVVLGDCGCE